MADENDQGNCELNLNETSRQIPFAVLPQSANNSTSLEAGVKNSDIVKDKYRSPWKDLYSHRKSPRKGLYSGRRARVVYLEKAKVLSDEEQEKFEEMQENGEILVKFI